MDIQHFLLSDQRKDRIRRHLVFWLLWWLYFSVTHAASPFGKAEISYFKNPAFTFTEAVFLVLSQVPLVYLTVYYVLPRFILRKKYTMAVILITVFWAIGGLYHYYLINNLLPKITTFLLDQKFTQNTQRTPGASFFMAVLGAYKGSLTITAFAFMLKFAKYWYLKEQRNLQLQQQNTEAQLQLLTAQVHPHFLFNTLNNIYSQAQNESPQSAKMIITLSDMLRYILYEGKHSLVPLEKELQMILDYINLEKIRYGNKLELHYLVTDKTEQLYIAPLMILPFVENCFKHGASNVLQNPWINFTVEIKDDTLAMKLMNGKSGSDDIVKTPGIGISNVKQRLQLLYPGKHELHIREEEEVFIVDLKMQLERKEKAGLVENKKPEKLYA